MATVQQGALPEQPAEDMVRIGIRLSRALRIQLRMYVAATDRRQEDVCAEAVAEYLARRQAA